MVYFRIITGDDQETEKKKNPDRIITKWILKLTLLKYFMLLADTKSNAFTINFYNNRKDSVESTSFT